MYVTLHEPVLRVQGEELKEPDPLLLQLTGPAGTLPPDTDLTVAVQVVGTPRPTVPGLQLAVVMVSTLSVNVVVAVLIPSVVVTVYVPESRLIPSSA